MAVATWLCLLLTGCSKDDFDGPEKGGGDKATLILNIGLNGTEYNGATRAISTGDYNDAKPGELMRTLRVIIVDANNMVEHNLFFDNLANLDRYTTDRVEVSPNNRKTFYFVANERAIRIEGHEDASDLLSGFKQGSTIDEADMKALVLMSDKHKPDWDKDDTRLLPITDIDYFNVGDAGQDYTKTFWIHRAAIKYTFIINNQTDKPVSLDSLMLIGASDREFLFPNASGYTVTDKTANNYRPITYDTPPGANFREIKLALGKTVPGKTTTTLPSIYFTEGLRLRGEYTDEEGKKVEDVYKMSMRVNDVRSEWRNLDWFYPETPTQLKSMVDVPRNTHVVVEVTVRPQEIVFVACVQPYAEQRLEPFFGLARDKDGNIIRRFMGDGTFWADNPRYNVDPDDDIKDDYRKTIWQDEDGDEIIKKFKDGSMLCVESMYRDWIHDDTEKDYEYIFEKNVPNGNMVIIREKSPAINSHLLNDTTHNHDVDDRPLFVKLTNAFMERHGLDYPVGTHVMVRYNDRNEPIEYSRVDNDGDTIIQANGYQFRGSEYMNKWMDTYLCKRLKSTDPDGTKHFEELLKRRDGTLIEVYRPETKIRRK